VHGELAQLIAIAAHGSAWLAGRTGAAPPELEGASSTFQYVRGVRFELAGSLLKSSIISDDVADWFAGVRRRGITRLWLAIPGSGGVDRKLLAFTGTTAWYLVGTTRKNQGEVWRAAWTVGDGDDPDHRIWDVDYRGRRMFEAAPPPSNMADAAERLKAALTRAAAFATDQGIDEWAALFDAALKLGDAPDPVPPYHPDMFPPTAYGRPARRLLAMATRSDVFGGMGSWNDLGFEPGGATLEYEEISAELYATVAAAFMAAVNGPIER